MNKQAVLVETLNGLETVNATGSGKLWKRYEDALNNHSDSGNKIRALSMFIINLLHRYNSMHKWRRYSLVYI